MRRFGSGWRLAVVGFVVAAGAAGCKGKTGAAGGDSKTGAAPDEAARSAAPREVAAPLDARTLGTITGTVHFAGKAPERVKIDMSQDPVCSMASGENLSEQYVVRNGGLANVYVYVKSGPAAAMSALSPAGQAVAVLDQKGCQYVPHVLAVMRGGSVEFRNSDATMHNIHTMPTVVGNETIDVSQGPKGSPVVRRFMTAETMLPVRCNNHPWMNAFINVSATPFFAVSDPDGRFRIAGLPPGTYALAAVHEKLGEQTATVTVEAQKSAAAQFRFERK